jgi:phosphatidylglycerophosphate synthase
MRDLVEAAAMSRGGAFRTARFLAVSTGLRILLTPVVMALLMADGHTPDTAADVAAILFCLAAATDWIDGRLARRWGVTTKFGSFLDTTADKLLVTGGLVALVAVDRASPWIAVIIVGRELVIMGLRGVLAAEAPSCSPPRWASSRRPCSSSRSRWRSFVPEARSPGSTSTSGSWSPRPR